MDSQLQVLNKLVGTWESQVTVKSPEGELAYTSQTQFEWVLGGQFLQDVGTSSDSEHQHIGMWSYDSEAEVYRSSYFLCPSGAPMHFTHKWDETLQKMTGESDLGNGMTLNTVDQFLSDNTYEWTAVIATEAGDVITEMHGVCQKTA